VSEQAPQVAVVMTVYNGMPYLTKAVDSILEQSVLDLELIVVDDGSTDETPRVLADYAAKDPRVRVLTNSPNRGLTPSRNRGIEHVRAPYFAIQDADDFSTPDRLEKELAYLKTHPNAAAVFPGFYITDVDQRPVVQRFVLDHPEALRARMQESHCVHHPAGMVRTDVMREVGGYRDGFPFPEYDWGLRVLEKYDFGSIHEVLYYYRWVPNSLSVAGSSVQQACQEIAQQFARERAATGTDSYAAYVAAGKIPKMPPSVRNWGQYHWRLARYAFAGDELGHCLRHVLGAMRCAPLRPRYWAGVLVKLTAKAALRRLGLLGVFRRVFRKDKIPPATGPAS